MKWVLIGFVCRVVKALIWVKGLLLVSSSERDQREAAEGIGREPKAFSTRTLKLSSMVDFRFGRWSVLLELLDVDDDVQLLGY